jgi:hypothetical protein
LPALRLCPRLRDEERRRYRQSGCDFEFEHFLNHITSREGAPPNPPACSWLV